MSEIIVSVPSEQFEWFMDRFDGDVLMFGYQVTGEIVRCKDCKFAALNSLGECKYCEKFWRPDVDGYGADPQVNLPGDFFCKFGERKES